MKEIFEAMLGVFFVAVMMIGSSSVISTSIDAQNADATMQAYVTEVEHSNFSDQVLEAIFEQADADGYRNVKMELYERDADGDPILYYGQPYRVVNSPSAVGDTHAVYMAKLSMDYEYALDFLDQKTNHTLTAYAR